MRPPLKLRKLGGRYELHIVDIPPWGSINVWTLEAKDGLGFFVPDVGLYNAFLIFGPSSWELVLGTGNTIDEDILKELRRTLLPEVIEEICATLELYNRLPIMARKELKTWGMELKQEAILNISS